MTRENNTGSQAKSQQISPKHRKRETQVSKNFSKNHKKSVHRNMNLPRDIEALSNNIFLLQESLVAERERKTEGREEEQQRGKGQREGRYLESTNLNRSVT